MSNRDEMENLNVKRALISVSDKEGLTEFVKKLQTCDIEIISTGGTKKNIEDEGIQVKSVEEITNFPEIMNGRVKTIHPKIFGGILAREEDKEQKEDLEIVDINLVVVNLYPFEETSKKEGELSELIEMIDIGGASLIRAAAKNYSRVCVVVDPEDYEEVSSAIEKQQMNLDMRERLALKAFQYTAKYDAYIQTELSERFDLDILSNDYLNIIGKRKGELRYAENPHQSGAFYVDSKVDTPSIATAKQIQGKQLSYNNILDFDGALAIVADFEEPTVVIIKHTNPCGVASSENLSEAYDDALETDPSSAFGGIIGVNREVDIETANKIVESFKEGVVAPSFSKESIKILSQKKNMRLLEVGDIERYEAGNQMKSVAGGWLIQEPDQKKITREECSVVTDKQPSEEEWIGLMYGWKLIKHIRSNAIVFTKGKRTVGIGAGQMSRVDSVRIASFKSRPDAKGTVMASDAFFPFPDGIEAAAEAGITAIIQSGGSIRDQEVIDSANKIGVSMVFTGERHFRH